MNTNVGYLIVHTAYKHVNTYDIYIPTKNILLWCMVGTSTKNNFDKSFRITPSSIKPNKCNKIIVIPNKILNLSKLEKLYKFLNTQLITYINDCKK